jgi:hypothetical protein
MAQYTLYRNFKAPYTYFAEIANYNFNPIALFEINLIILLNPY